MVIVRLGRRTIDDSNEVVSDDDAVLAFLLGILGDNVLFYYFHGLRKSFWNLVPDRNYGDTVR